MKIIYTKCCFWADAFTVNTSLILIHPDHKQDAPLLAHERVHQAQMRSQGTTRFWLKYLFSKSFRQRVEVEAYKVQIAAGASAITCASHLTRYWLGITQSEALALLEDAK